MKAGHIAGALAAILVAMGAAGLLLWRRGHPVTSADYAAWVLAITLGGAVVAMFLIVLWQHQLQEHRQVRAADQLRASRAEAAYQLASYVEVVCKKVIEHTADMQADRAYLTTAAGELQSIGASLERYDPVDFPTYGELRPLTAVIAARAALSQQLSSVLAATDSQALAAELNCGFTSAIGGITKDVAALQSIAIAKKLAAQDI